MTEEKNTKLEEKTVNKPRKPRKKKVDNSDAAILAAARAKREVAKNQKGAALEGQVLNVPQRKGYVRRWVRGTDQRLDQLSKKGYSFVNDKEKDGQVLTTDLGTAKSQLVGTDKNGGARRDYLMEIPEELYLEDQKIKEQKTQRASNAYRHVEHDADELATPEGRSKLYTPR